MAGDLAPLAGFTVAVTADRRRDEQVELLRRRGAAVLEAPTVRTVPLVDGDELRARIEALVAEPPDAVVLLTAVGVRGLVGAAEGIGLDEALLDVLASTRLLARGPKALGAATALGLDVEWWAGSERSAEVAAHLAPECAAGLTVAVVRDGADQPYLADQLRQAGATSVDVPVYRWELPADPAPLERLVGTIASGGVDAVTFTSSPAIRHLFGAAASLGAAADLRDALGRHVTPVCVGPVCAETLASLGVDRAVQPRRARLGAMVQSLVAAFGDRRRQLAVGGTAGVLQGNVLVLAGETRRLADRERGLLEVLADAGGAVVPKQRLLREVWRAEPADEHAVEVAVARLRRRLGPAGAAILTVPRRGYRLA